MRGVSVNLRTGVVLFDNACEEGRRWIEMGSIDDDGTGDISRFT